MTIEQKRMMQMGDTIDALLLYDPIILDGEIVIEKDSNQMKVGKPAATNLSGLPYFNPAALTPVLVTAATLNSSASLCGSLLRVKNAISFNLTLVSGDLAQSSTPVGITSHFPEGGFFYVQFDHDVTAVTTFRVTAGPSNTFWANEFGQSIAKASSTFLDFNNGNDCQGKLYLFFCLAGGLWQIYEMDSKDVWEAAKIQLPSFPSYGGFFRSTAGKALVNGPPDWHVSFDGTMPSNVGVDTASFLIGELKIITPGDYWIKGAVTAVTANLVPPIFLRIVVNTITPASAFVEYSGTWPSSYTPMTVDTILRLEANDLIYLQMEHADVPAPILQWAQLIVEKLDLSTNT